MSSFWINRLYHARQQQLHHHDGVDDENANNKSRHYHHSSLPSYPLHYPKQTPQQHIDHHQNEEKDNRFLRTIRYFIRKNAVFDLTKGCSPGGGEKHLLPHQQVVSMCVHPRGPISKLLVCHRPGSGKTRTMVSLCNNFFEDGRPIVVLLPNKTIVRKFLRTLLSVPGKWSMFVKRMMKLLSLRQVKDSELINILALRTGGRGRSMLLLLEKEKSQRKKRHDDYNNTSSSSLLLYYNIAKRMTMNQDDDEQVDDDDDVTAAGEGKVLSTMKPITMPAAPLYVVTYNDGRNINSLMLDDDDEDINNDNNTTAILSKKKHRRRRITWGKQKQWNPNTDNLMDRCVILVDELHQLYTNPYLSQETRKSKGVENDEETSTILLPSLGILKSKISQAKKSVVVGFTATPVITPNTKGWRNHRSITQLLREWNKQLRECVHFFRFSEKGQKRSSKNPDFSGFVSYFDAGEGHIFPRLMGKTKWTLHGEIDDSTGKEISAILPVKVHMVTLHGLNLIMYMHNLQSSITKVLSDDEDIEPMMLTWCNQAFSAKSPPDYTPPISLHQKLHLVAKSIEENPVKTLLLVERDEFASVSTLERYLQKRNITVDRLRPETQQRQLSRYNDLENNDMGQDVMCLVAEIDAFVESSDFFTVRRLILLNPPPNLGSLHQLVGRITRSCAFSSRFTAENQQVQVDMYVAQLPVSLQSRLLQSYMTFVKDITVSFAKTKPIAASILREMVGIDDRIATEIVYSNDDDNSSDVDDNALVVKQTTTTIKRNVKEKFASYVERTYRDTLTAWDRWHQHDRLIMTTPLTNDHNNHNSSLAPTTTNDATKMKNNNNSISGGVKPEGLMTVDMLRATRLVREQCAYSRFMQKNIIDKAIDTNLYYIGKH